MTETWSGTRPTIPMPPPFLLGSGGPRMGITFQSALSSLRNARVIPTLEHDSGTPERSTRRRVHYEVLCDDADRRQ